MRSEIAEPGGDEDRGEIEDWKDDQDIGDDDDDQQEYVDKGRGKSHSMQAKRIQRIRGNYEGEMRALPSGQDWPQSHSGVEIRKDVVEERGSMLEEKGGSKEGGGDA